MSESMLNPLNPSGAARAMNMPNPGRRRFGARIVSTGAAFAGSRAVGRLAGSAALLLGSAPSFAAEATVEPTAQQLLVASDAARNPDRPFGLITTLIEYRQGKQVDTSRLQIYSKAAAKGGQYRTLLRFLAPVRDVGKLMLQDGTDLWFFDPSSKASIRISPQQRLLGQAANGDVVTVNLALDYSARIAARETVQDGDRQPRDAYKLELAAARPEVTYHRIELWLDASDQRLIKGRYFSESGHLLKTAYFRKYQQQLGQLRPTETVIIDGLDSGWVTVLRFSDYAWREIPDSWMQRDYLPRFRPE